MPKKTSHKKGRSHRCQRDGGEKRREKSQGKGRGWTTAPPAKRRARGFWARLQDRNRRPRMQRRGTSNSRLMQVSQVIQRTARMPSGTQNKKPKDCVAGLQGGGRAGRGGTDDWRVPTWMTPSARMYTLSGLLWSMRSKKQGLRLCGAESVCTYTNVQHMRRWNAGGAVLQPGYLCRPRGALSVAGACSP